MYMNNLIQEFFDTNGICTISFDILNDRFSTSGSINIDVSTIQSYIALIHTDYQDIVSDAIKSPQSITLEYQIKTKNQEYAWIKSLIKIIYENDALSHIQIVSQNIDDKKSLEAKVKNLQNYMNNTADLLKAVNNSAIVSITDKDGNIEYANDKFYDISKYTQDEIIGNTHNITKHPKEGDIYEDIKTTLAENNIWQGVIKNKSKDGKTYYLDTIITPITNDKGETIKYILVKYDVTKEKLLEKAKNKKLIKLKTSTLLNLKSEERKFNNKIVELEHNINILLTDKRKFDSKIDSLNNELLSKNTQIARLIDETKRLENTLKTLIKKYKNFNSQSKYKRKAQEAENIIHSMIAEFSGLVKDDDKPTSQGTNT